MNQKEFETIAEQLRQQALTQAQKVLRNSADADDLAQDAMLRLWAVHTELRDREHAFRLARIAVRQLMVDSFRHKRHTSALIVEMDGKQDDGNNSWQPPDTHSISPQARMEVSEDERWLSERIATLPSREMQVMRMRQTEQRTNSEIASILGIGTASVATMLSSARRKIFEDLKKRNRQ